jgi:dienelactone hydrolase
MKIRALHILQLCNASLCGALIGVTLIGTAQASTRSPDPVPTIALIPLPASATSSPPSMQAQVFKPPGQGPFKVLLYAHGRPAYAKERARLLRPIHARHVQYWLRKGYAVVAPIRPGYGTPPLGTGGADQESSGVGYSASGQCIRQPAPANLAINAAAAQRAALDWARQQPWARADHIVLEGQSGGGLATVALCAANPPGVKACINFSGGAGGDPQHAPGKVCAPEKIAALMRQYGATTQAPSLWLYAPNDLYWGAEAPVQWHSAFNQAATSSQSTPATFYQSPAIGSDGHSLQRAGSQQWAPVLDAWLKKNKL